MPEPSAANGRHRQAARNGLPERTAAAPADPGIWRRLSDLWSSIHEAAQPAARSPGELGQLLIRLHGPWSLTLRWPASILPIEWRIPVTPPSPWADTFSPEAERAAARGQRLAPVQSTEEQRARLRSCLVDVQRQLTTDNVLWVRRALAPWTPPTHPQRGGAPDHPDALCAVSHYAVIFGLAASRLESRAAGTLPDLRPGLSEWRPKAGDLIAAHRLLEDLVVRRAAPLPMERAHHPSRRTPGGLRNASFLEACECLLLERKRYLEVLRRPRFLQRRHWYSKWHADPEVERAADDRARDEAWWRAFGELLAASPLTALVNHDVFGVLPDRTLLRPIWETGDLVRHEAQTLGPDGESRAGGALLPGRWTEFWQTQLTRTLVAVVRNPVPSASPAGGLSHLVVQARRSSSTPPAEHAEYRTRLEHLAAVLQPPLSPAPTTLATRPKDESSAAETSPPQAARAAADIAPLAEPSSGAAPSVPPAAVPPASPAVRAETDPAARALHYRFLDQFVRHLVLSQENALREQAKDRNRDPYARAARSPAARLESADGPCFLAFVETVLGASVAELGQSHWTLSDSTRGALRTLFDPHGMRAEADDPRDVSLSNASQATGIEVPFLVLFRARLDDESAGIAVPADPSSRAAPQRVSVRSLLASWVTEILNRTPQRIDAQVEESTAPI